MNFRKLVARVSVLVFFAGASAHSAVEIDAELTEELDRLAAEERLSDPVQAARVSSVNIVDNRFAVRTADVSRESREPRAIKVVIDAGHGGRDLGARGDNGLLEKRMALRLARMVRQELIREAKARGVSVDVMLTRDSDNFLSLHERVRRANAWGGDLFVSIHGNSAAVKHARGFEVYFLSAEATDQAATSLANLENQGEVAPLTSDVISILNDVQQTRHVSTSSDFAERVFESMAVRSRSNGRGVRQAPFSVLIGTEMPALLVEVGYLTNPVDAKLLSNGHFLRRMANAISAGIVEYGSRRGRSPSGGGGMVSSPKTDMTETAQQRASRRTK